MSEHNKAIGLIIIAIGLTFSFSSCSRSVSPSTQSSTTTSSTASANIAGSENGITTSWINSQEAIWATKSNYPLLVYPFFQTASYDNIEAQGVNTSVLNENLNMLEALGGTGITIHMGYDPWLINIPNARSQDQEIASSLKSNSQSLMLADASAENYRHNKLSWSDFKTAWINRVTTLAEMFHPAYYTVIKEPPWYIPMIAGVNSNGSGATDAQLEDPNQWASLLQSLITAVKSVSPSTKVGIAVSGDLYDGKPSGTLDTALLKLAVKMSNLDYIGFDLYTSTAFSNTVQFLHSNGANGKEIWIAETWSTTTPNYAFSQTRSSLDVAWAKFLFHYAHYIGATGIVPFYTDVFSSYSQPPNSASGLLSYFNSRTPVFNEFQSLTSSQGK
ncbi:MAG: hypothetical protein HKL80_08055 [Acidimicrobiales bacterium]|nr:hypothetical protein [Acidimicrobiales bacterium]